MKTQYTVHIGDGAGNAEAILTLTPRQALYVAQRILNQLDLRDHDTTVSLIVSADVELVA